MSGTFIPIKEVQSANTRRMDSNVFQVSRYFAITITIRSFDDYAIMNVVNSLVYWLLVLSLCLGEFSVSGAL